MHALTQAEQNPPSRSRLLRYGVSLIKLGIALAILYLLYKFGLISLEGLSRAANSPWLLVGVGLLVLASLPLMFFRWVILLRVAGVTLGLGDVIYVWCLGLLGNLVLFGSAGGDTVRIGYLALRTKGQRHAAVISVAMDRYLGWMGILTVSVLGVLLHSGIWAQDSPLALMMLAILAIFAASCLLHFAPLFAAKWVTDYLARQNWSGRGRIKRTFFNVWKALLAYRSSSRHIVYCWGLSTLSYLTTVGAISLTGYAMGVKLMNFADYILATAVSALANLLPITPGGLGLGEATFAQVGLWLQPGTEAGVLGGVALAFRAVSFVVCVTSTLICLSLLPSKYGRDKKGLPKNK